MTKAYRDWSIDQAYLFPPSPHDWLPEGDLVYFLLDTVATLDLTPIFAHYERELGTVKNLSLHSSHLVLDRIVPLPVEVVRT